jgi:hypothetical protein
VSLYSEKPVHSICFFQCNLCRHATLTKTAYGSVDIVNDYQSLAKPAALCVTPGGMGGEMLCFYNLSLSLGT